jgi:hypothetical protein
VAVVRWERLAWLSGPAFVACTVVAALVFSPPGYGAPRAQLVTYLVRHYRRGEVAGLLGGLALISFLVLLAALVSVLRARGAGWPAEVVFGSGLVALAIGALQAVVVLALSYRIAKDDHDPSLAKGIYDLQTGTSTLLAFPLASLMAAAALASFRPGRLPRWYAFGSAAAGVVVLVRGGALAHTGFYSPGGGYGTVAYVAFLLWVLATSAVLAVHARPPGAAA